MRHRIIWATGTRKVSTISTCTIFRDKVNAMKANVLRTLNVHNIARSLARNMDCFVVT